MIIHDDSEDAPLGVLGGRASALGGASKIMGIHI